MTRAGAGRGHNGGPTVEPASAWRRYCWQAARAALLPKLPIEIVRLQVRRAAEIGLDRSTISRQFAAVVRAGYVQKLGDSSDARVSQLQLTARGVAARRKLGEVRGGATWPS